MTTPRELDLPLPSGRLHALSWGPEDAPPAALGLPGLTANAWTFAAIGERLARDGRRLVALDLRGRGASETTPPGTYGWPAHARDAVDAAEALGAQRVALVGHSMGAFVALQAAADHPERVSAIVLVDAGGKPDPDALVPVGHAIERLGRRWPSADAFVAEIRDAGAARPWSARWERVYRNDAVAEPDGTVRAAADREAVLEDATYGGAHDPRDQWPAVRCPALALRAGVPLGAGGGGILSAADAARFAAEVPGAQVRTIDAGHYGVIVHEDTAEAVAELLSRPR